MRKKRTTNEAFGVLPDNGDAKRRKTNEEENNITKTSENEKN